MRADARAGDCVCGPDSRAAWGARLGERGRQCGLHFTAGWNGRAAARLAGGHVARRGTAVAWTAAGICGDARGEVRARSVEPVSKSRGVITYPIPIGSCERQRVDELGPSLLAAPAVTFYVTIAATSKLGP